MTDRQAEDTEPFHTVFVCRANECRSQVAEHIARDLLEDKFGPGVENFCTVSSAGILVSNGARILPVARRVLVDLGVPAPDSPATALDRELLESADLVLTATRKERSAVARMSPAAVRRTFTIRQFARMCRAGTTGDGQKVLSGHDLTSLARRGQARLQPSPELDDIDDPPAHMEKVRECTEVILSELESVVRCLDPR